MIKIKRGRPTIRIEVQNSILNTLSEKGIPLTISALAKAISNKMQRTVSWNTIQKYIDELIAMGKIKPIDLPHSKDETKKGLTVYTINKE